MIARAALQTVVVRSVILAASLISSIITARTLGPAGRGVYYFVLMLGGLGVQFSNLGLHASNTYLVAADRNRFGPLLGNSLWVSLVAASIAACLIVCVSVTTGRAADAGNAAYWSIAYAPCALFVLLASNLFVGIGRVRTFNGIQLTSALLTMAGVALVGVLGGTVGTFLSAMVVATFATAVVAFVCGMRTGLVPLRFDRRIFVLGLRYASKAFVVGLLGFAVTRANVFVLADAASQEQLGLYSVAMQFFDVLSILPISISIVLFPSLIGSADPWRDAVRCALWTAALMILPCAVIAVVAEPLVIRVFGAGFAPASVVTQLILPAALFVGVVSILSQYLAAAGYPRAIIVIWAAAVPAITVVGSWLVPKYGATGAAVALSVTYFVVLIAILGFSKGFASRQTRLHHAELI